jgi:hypothetical protein
LRRPTPDAVPIRARYCWSGSVELSLLRKGSLQRYRLAAQRSVRQLWSRSCSRGSSRLIIIITATRHGRNSCQQVPPFMAMMTITSTTCCHSNGHNYNYRRVLYEANDELVVNIVLYSVFIQTKTRKAARPPTCCPPSRWPLLLRRWCDRLRQNSNNSFIDVLGCARAPRSLLQAIKAREEKIHHVPTWLPSRWLLLLRRWCDRR